MREFNKNWGKNLIWILTVLWMVISFGQLKGTVQQESAEKLYQEALFKKEAEGDLRGAIELFRKVISLYPENRRIGAQAQLQIGICSEKLGLEEAEKAYLKVIENYPEQAEAVNTAREKLALIQKYRAAGEEESRTLNVRQIWTGTRQEYTGLPIDDKRYDFTADPKTGDLTVYDSTTGERRRLTDKESWSDSSGLAGSASLSPDGQHVVFIWRRTEDFQELHAVRFDGSGHRILYADEDSTAVSAGPWLPDGKHFLATFADKEWNYQILKISVVDGSVELIRPFNPREAWGASSPDGRFLLYDVPQQENTRKRDIYLLDINTKQDLPLVEHPADDRELGYAPDGKWILFSSDRTGTWDAWLLPVEDGKPTGDPRLIKKDIGWLLSGGFTQNGSFYYSKGTWIYHIYVTTLDFETGTVLVPPEKVSPRIVPFNATPDLSSDGKKLAFISDGALGFSRERPGIITVRSLETGREREYPLKLDRLYRMCWFPDGRSILVQNAPENGSHHFYSLDTQTGVLSTAVRVEPDIGITDPAGVAPDGNTLFYRRIVISELLHQIAARDIESSLDTILYPSKEPARLMNPVLSPDGRRLVYLLYQRDRGERALMVLPAGGGTPRELFRVKSPEIIDYSSIEWTPDSLQIIFGREVPQQEEKRDVWIIPAEGGEPRRTDLRVDWLYHMRIHPDGRRLFFTSGNYIMEILVMENFLPEEKAKKKSK